MRFTEFTNAGTVKLDAEAGVLRGVKLLGTVSANKRRYPMETIRKAAPLYEGSKVNVNHARPQGQPRGYEERIGVIRSVRCERDGLFGDFHFNPKHPLAEQLIWDAENAPGNVGFSHDVEAKASRRDETLVVEEITHVHSVDLVADPATTNGLFESRGSAPASPSRSFLADILEDDPMAGADTLFGDKDTASEYLDGTERFPDMHQVIVSDLEKIAENTIKRMSAGERGVEKLAGNSPFAAVEVPFAFLFDPRVFTLDAAESWVRGKDFEVLDSIEAKREPEGDVQEWVSALTDW